MLIAVLLASCLGSAFAAAPAKVNADAAQFEEDPIPKGQVLAGHPRARTSLLDTQGDRVAGVWHCTPGRFRWVFPADEFVYFLAGEASITWESGESLTVRQGDYALLPKGKAVWTIKKAVRKTFVYGP